MSTSDWLSAIGCGDLPDGWALASVGSRYEVQLGKMLNADRAADPDEPGAAPYLRNVNVQWDRIDTTDLKWMRFGTEDRGKYALRPGDLLVCEGGEIGRCALWDSDRQDCFFQKALMRVRPRGVDDVAWLALCLRALSDGGALSAGAEKSTIDHLPAEKLRALRVPLPAPEIQRDVLAALDAETARIDDLVAARTRQRGLVGERLANVLEAAFSLAPGRRSVRLKQVLSTPPCYGVLVPKFDSDGVPFIRVGDLVALANPGRELTRIDSAQSREYSRTLVEAGDVLVSVVGSVDKCAVVSPELAGANVARAVARLRPVADVPPELLEAWMSTPSYLRQAALATGSDTAQPTLNMGDLANFRLHVPESRAGVESLTTELRERRAVASAAITVIDRQVALLRERREALITAALTGRLKLPGTSTAKAAA